MTGSAKRSDALTRSFKEPARTQASADPAYREALLQESVDPMLAGDIDIAETILCGYVVTIPAEQWNDFEAWATAPARENDALRKLAAARPAWQD